MYDTYLHNHFIHFHHVCVCRVWYQIDDDDVIRKRLHVTTFKPRRTEDMEQMIVRVNKSIADDKSKGTYSSRESFIN